MCALIHIQCFNIIVLEPHFELSLCRRLGLNQGSLMMFVYYSVSVEDHLKLILIVLHNYLLIVWNKMADWLVIKSLGLLCNNHKE